MTSPNTNLIFTKEEVEKHNRKDDCWIIIDGNVCDVTEFLNDHPGGPDILLEYVGKDATNEFKDIGHSKDALELVQKYKIGNIN